MALFNAGRNKMEVKANHFVLFAVLYRDIYNELIFCHIYYNMKRILPHTLRNLLFCFGLLLISVSARATHVVGADLYYTWITGTQYKITVVIYGDCGPASSGSFGLLPTATPQVCVFDGATSVTSLSLNIQAPAAGVEITPVCPSDAGSTQCTNTAFAIPGIKKFVYTKLYTVPYASANWKFVFTGSLGAASSAGRAAALTNLPAASPTTMSSYVCNSK